jgi:hypothetical protein
MRLELDAIRTTLPGGGNQLQGISKAAVVHGTDLGDDLNAFRHNQAVSQ